MQKVNYKENIDSSFNSTEYSKDTFIALDRFSLGFTSELLKTVEKNPRKWILNQLHKEIIFSKRFPSSCDVIKRESKIIELSKELKRNKKKSKNYTDINKNLDNLKSQTYRDSNEIVANSLKLELELQDGFPLRLINFFSNHFSVSRESRLLMALAPTLEREAIAPNIFGHFSDMLKAVIKHPAMLVYLDNIASVGPNSPLATYSRGMNENLAREILELHTLGVNGSYTQRDVIELAKSITGWSVGKPHEDEPATFLFRQEGQEPGSIEVLNHRYKNDGLNSGEVILEMLSRHKNTAQHISRKLAQHFIADIPPEKVIEAMTKTWLKTDGNLSEVYKTMLTHDSSWRKEKTKFKEPRRYVVSVIRALKPYVDVDTKKLIGVLESMGQRPFEAGSPAGFEDSVDYWNNPYGILQRIDWVSNLIMTNHQNIELMIRQLPLSYLEKSTSILVEGSDTRQNALVLYFSSPDFMEA